MFTPEVLAVSAGLLPATDSGMYQLVGIVLTVVLIGAAFAGVASWLDVRLDPESPLYCALPGPDGETCTRLDRHAGLHRSAYTETSWTVEYLSCFVCGHHLSMTEASSRVDCRGCGLSMLADRIVLRLGESLVIDYDNVVAVAQPISVN